MQIYDDFIQIHDSYIQMYHNSIQIYDNSIPIYGNSIQIHQTRSPIQATTRYAPQLAAEQSAASNDPPPHAGRGHYNFHGVIASHAAVVTGDTKLRKYTAAATIPSACKVLLPIQATTHYAPQLAAGQSAGRSGPPPQARLARVVLAPTPLCLEMQVTEQQLTNPAAFVPVAPTRLYHKHSQSAKY